MKDESTNMMNIKKYCILFSFYVSTYTCRRKSAKYPLNRQINCIYNSPSSNTDHPVCALTA